MSTTGSKKIARVVVSLSLPNPLRNFIVRWILLLAAFLLNLSAYDTSFSSIIKEVYEENHTSQGDWCDELADQIASAIQKKGRHLSSIELEQEGIDPDYLDAMALSFCKKYPDTYIATVWPTLSYDYEDLIYEILSKEAVVIYKKTFTLKNNGPKALMETIPEKAAYLSRDFHHYFDPTKPIYPMMCFVIRAPAHENTVRAKRTLRNIVKLDPYCMHINDTHAQGLDLAHLLLNNNSIHFLNHHKPHQFKHFNALFPFYEKFLRKKSLPKQDFCVDGSCVLSAYGLRDSAMDFDFLSTRFTKFGNILPLDHHNEAWERLGLDINAVIYNPKNFFYYKNHKFASLLKIRAFKALQGRDNDIRDVMQIDTLLKNP